MEEVPTASEADLKNQNQLVNSVNLFIVVSIIRTVMILSVMVKNLRSLRPQIFNHYRHHHSNFLWLTSNINITFSWQFISVCMYDFC